MNTGVLDSGNQSGLGWYWKLKGLRVSNWPVAGCSTVWDTEQEKIEAVDATIQLQELREATYADPAWRVQAIRQKTERIGEIDK